MDKELGKVYLVGAGPGDIGLLTIKALKLIEEADVVLYDKLVGVEILNLIPKSSNRIDVGKKPHNHLVPQESINQILVDEAKKGNKVVRLKGGDPFLFGRGGEEIELLIENNIIFEVVPGITSGIAVPAYAGVPVTHRDICSSVHFITGHTKLNKVQDLDYEALVRLNGTLVFYMGISVLKDICNGLINAKMSEDMPAMVIEMGTTARQRKIVSTLGTIYKDVQINKVKPPSIIVVGNVCSLSDKFDWVNNRPLNGKRIIVTRPERLCSTLSEKIRYNGGEAIEFPSIKTIEMNDNEIFDNVIKNIDKYKWFVFTSVVGAEIFLEKFIKQYKDIRKLYNFKIAVIGCGTQKPFSNYSIVPDFMPEKFNVRELAEGLVKKIKNNDKVVVFRAKEGSLDLNEVFEENNVKYEDIPVYETVYNTQRCEFSHEVIKNNDFDFAAFTSASTVRGFVNATNGIDYSKITAICIGKQTQEEALIYGMNTIVSESATIDSIIKTMIVNIKI